MTQFYQYQKKRREFGKPCTFVDTPVIIPRFPEEDGYARRQVDPKEVEYVVRNPNFIELDNITELSQHFVNTLRVSTGEKGMCHREGGWPEAIDPTEQQQYVRYMRKIDRDQNFAAQVKSLCEVAEKCMLQNKQIDMFEEYFMDEESEHMVENISTKTLMLLKDPPDVCKRSVSGISWHTQGPTKLATSYAISRFQQTPEKMKNNSYIWDLQNPNAPEITLNSPSPVTSISYNHKLTDIIGGGCYNGIVAIWDSRKGKDPVQMTQVEKSHSDPVTHFQWQMTKTGQDCVSVSTDGYCHFWDTRKLKEDRVQSLAITDGDNPDVLIGGTTLENSAETATKYLIGTEQGTVYVANKKTRRPVQITARYGAENKHLGPIYSISRNIQFSKIFMTVGDWGAKIWMDDIKNPLVRTRYHKSYLTDGCFSPTRVGVFFLTRKDGWLDIWDYFYRQNEVAYTHKVSDAALTSIKVSYSGGGGNASQISGGKLLAIGDQDGTVTLLQLCESLYTIQKNEREIMTEVFNREMIKEKNLETLKKSLQNEKKKAPKDKEALKIKADQKKIELIKQADDNFNKLFDTMRKESPHQEKLEEYAVDPKQERREEPQREQEQEREREREIQREREREREEEKREIELEQERQQKQEREEKEERQRQEREEQQARQKSQERQQEQEKRQEQNPPQPQQSPEPQGEQSP